MSSASVAHTSIELSLQRDYRFEVDFKATGVPLLQTDAGPPLGEGSGPDSEQLLVAAVANCLSASLLFALRKYRNEAPPMRTSARAELAPNAQGRTRVGRIDVEIHLGVPAARLHLTGPCTGAVRGLLCRHAERARGDPGRRARVRWRGRAADALRADSPRREYAHRVMRQRDRHDEQEHRQRRDIAADAR